MSDFDDPVQYLDDTVAEFYGDAVMYMPLAGTAFPIMAIFSSPAMREETAPEASFHDAFVRASDFDGQDPPRAGDALQVGARVYRVFDVKADFGFAYKLSLQKS
jgi:hypothetical protein